MTDGLADADYDGLVGIIYCLSLSNELDLDVSYALLGKLQTNELRYPADKFQGRFRRPERKYKI